MNFKQYLVEMTDEEPLLKFDDEMYEFRVILDSDHGLNDAIKNFALDNDWEAETYRSIKNASIVEKTLQGQLKPDEIYTQYVLRKKPFVMLCFESDEDKADKGIMKISSYYRYGGYMGDGENVYYLSMKQLDPVITKMSRALLGGQNAIQHALQAATVYKLAEHAKKSNNATALAEYAERGIEILTWVVFD